MSCEETEHESQKWTLQTLRTEPCEPYEWNLANLKNWTLQTLRIEPWEP